MSVSPSDSDQVSSETIKGLFKRIEKSESTISAVADRSAESSARLERSVASLEATMQHFGETIARVNNRSTPWALILAGIMAVVTIYSLSLDPLKIDTRDNELVNRSQNQELSIRARELGRIDSRLNTNEKNTEDLRFKVERIQSTRVQPEDLERVYDLLQNDLHRLEDEIRPLFRVKIQ